MAKASNPVAIANGRPLVGRALEAARGLGCTKLWARAAGPHILLGLGGAEAFARVTPLGGQNFGLAFRSPDGDGEADERGGKVTWQPMLLVDELAHVVEHALIAESALPLQAAGM
jgi:hypothetical protein